MNCGQRHREPIGQQLNLENYRASNNTLAGIWLEYDRLGLKRQARDMTPSLDELLAADDEANR
jgi:hypothetical protein